MRRHARTVRSASGVTCWAVGDRVSALDELLKAHEARAVARIACFERHRELHADAREVEDSQQFPAASIVFVET